MQGPDRAMKEPRLSLVFLRDRGEAVCASDNLSGLSVGPQHLQLVIEAEIC